MATKQHDILSQDARDQVVGSMNNVLATLIDMALQSKQAHWNIRGPRFKSLHEHLDEIIDELRAASDEVAERVVTLGMPADGTLPALTKLTALSTIDTGFLNDKQVAEAIAERLSQTVGCLRKSIATVGEVDPVSEDLLIGIAAGLEKQLWMVQSNFLEA